MREQEIYVTAGEVIEQSGNSFLVSITREEAQ